MTYFIFGNFPILLETEKTLRITNSCMEEEIQPKLSIPIRPTLAIIIFLAGFKDVFLSLNRELF